MRVVRGVPSRRRRPHTQPAPPKHKALPSESTDLKREWVHDQQRVGGELDALFYVSFQFHVCWAGGGLQQKEKTLKKEKRKLRKRQTQGPGSALARSFAFCFFFFLAPPSLMLLPPQCFSFALLWASRRVLSCVSTKLAGAMGRTPCHGLGHPRIAIAIGSSKPQTLEGQRGPEQADRVCLGLKQDRSPGGIDRIHHFTQGHASPCPTQRSSISIQVSPTKRPGMLRPAAPTHKRLRPHTQRSLARSRIKLFLAGGPLRACARGAVLCLAARGAPGALLAGAGVWTLIPKPCRAFLLRHPPHVGCCLLLAGRAKDRCAAAVFCLAGPARFH